MLLRRKRNPAARAGKGERIRKGSLAAPGAVRIRRRCSSKLPRATPRASDARPGVIPERTTDGYHGSVAGNFSAEFFLPPVCTGEPAGR